MLLILVLLLIATTASAKKGALEKSRPSGNCVWDETKKAYNCRGKRIRGKGPAPPPKAPR